jgi:hypothetical protein
MAGGLGGGAGEEVADGPALPANVRCHYEA